MRPKADAPEDGPPEKTDGPEGPPACPENAYWNV